MTDHHAAAKSRQLLQRIVPAKVIQSRVHKRTFLQFADKVGMVYFGYVDQRHDEHRLVRGLTVSSKHRDNHYCIGSYDDYDVTLLERTDTLHFPGKPPKTHDWIIMTFDLHRSVDLPHVFLGLHTHSEAFYAQLFTKFANFNPLPLEVADGYDTGFLQRYAIYAMPAQALSAARLFNQSITKIIADHFGGLTIEISENCLYLYAEHQRPSAQLLEKMLKYGIWLARSLDQAVEPQ
ncbi:MAG: hypothetical protein ACHQTE_02790 [Candidatus Saccharimonadales bacterium]